MIEHTPKNKEFSFLAAFFTSFLCTFFGANAVAIKISLSGLGAFTAAGLRFSIASIAIFLWAGITGRSLSINKGQAIHLVIMAINFLFQMTLLYLGYSKTNASRGSLLVNLQPFFVLFLAHYFIPGDRITKRKFLGILLGFSGVAFVFLERKGVTAGFRMGDLMIGGSAFLWACNTIYIKRIIDAFEPFHIVLYPMMFSVPFLFLEGLLWDKPMIDHLDSRVLSALLYQGLVTASLGFVIWNSLLKKYGAVSLHSFLFITPVTGVLLGGIILGEPITYKIALALILIASGILVVHFKPQKRTLLSYLGRGT